MRYGPRLQAVHVASGPPSPAQGCLDLLSGGPVRVILADVFPLSVLQVGIVVRADLCVAIRASPIRPWRSDRGRGIDRGNPHRAARFLRIAGDARLEPSRRPCIRGSFQPVLEGIHYPAILAVAEDALTVNGPHASTADPAFLDGQTCRLR